MRLPFRILPSENDSGLVNNWKFLVPFGVMVIGMVLARAFGIVQ